MMENSKYMPYKMETHLTEICSENDIYTNLLDSWHINKKTCLNVLNNVSFNYPHYTKHDISHSEAIITNIEMLLGEDSIRSLSPTDTWLLLNAAYLHDFGMVIDNKVIEQNWDTKEFQKYLKELENSEDEELAESAIYINSLKDNLKDNRDARAWPVRVRKAVILIIADYYRRGHAKESQEYIQNMKDKLHIDLEYNGLIQHRLIMLLSDIAYLHNEASSRVLELDYKTDGFNADYAHPRFVALMLRMGDLLDADNNRFNASNEIVFGEIPHSSKNHLNKHMSTRHILITPDVIEYRADCAETEVYRETRNFLTWLKEEVEFWALNWKDIMPANINGSAPKLGKCELLLNGVPDIQGLSDLRFSISPEKAFEIIEGANIYDDKWVFLREVIQNALDACKIRMWRDISENRYKNWIKNRDLNKLQPYEIDNSVFDNYEVEVILSQEDDNNIRIIIKDNGIGISTEQFKKICDVGKSYMNDKQKQEEIENMPIWLRPTAGFGIGLQSIFLVSDYFEIYSKAANEEGIYARVESRKKKGYVQLSKSDRLENQGTEIHIIIPNDFDYQIRYDGKIYNYIQNEYNPFLPDKNLMYYIIWDELLEIIEGTYFSIKLRFEKKIVHTIQHMQFKKLEQKSQDGRYQYVISSDYSMQIWDNKSCTSVNINIEQDDYWASNNKYYFKGMELDDGFDAKTGISFEADFYGLDTKKCLLLDRTTATNEGYKSIRKITKDAVEFYRNEIKKIIFNETKDTQDKKYNRIYTFWTGLPLDEKKNVLDHNRKLFENINKNIDVLQKNQDGKYEVKPMDFKVIIDNLSEIAVICNYNDYPMFSLSDDDIIEKIIGILDKTGCCFKNIIMDEQFADLLNANTSKIQIICEGDNKINLKSVTVENQKLPRIADINTKKSLLRNLVFTIKRKYRYIHSMDIDNCMRKCISGLLEYETITTYDKPFGVSVELILGRGYIISPVTSKQWKDYNHLDKKKFVDTISGLEIFEQLIDYVHEHQLEAGKYNKDEICETYIKLIGDIYDACKTEQVDS